MIRITAHLHQDDAGPAHVTIYAGDPEPAPLPCGVLTMTTEEADELVARVQAGDLGPVDPSPEMAAHVLWHYNATGGMEPGPFTGALIAAIACADRANTIRVAIAYPGYALAVHWAAAEDGIRRLQDVARAMLIPAPAQDGGA